jgi:hypothetical protein
VVALSGAWLAPGGLFLAKLISLGLGHFARINKGRNASI